jgi:hypothetical protein
MMTPAALAQALREAEQRRLAETSLYNYEQKGSSVPSSAPFSSDYRPEIKSGSRVR